MEIKRFVVRELLPDTKYYMTYDGSTTIPACHETTTWIILNKPIYITKQQVRTTMSLDLGHQYIAPIDSAAGSLLASIPRDFFHPQVCSG